MAEPVEEFICDSCRAEFAIEMLDLEEDSDHDQVAYCPYCGEQLFLDWNDDDGYRGDDQDIWDDEEDE